MAHFSFAKSLLRKAHIRIPNYETTGKRLKGIGDINIHTANRYATSCLRYYFCSSVLTVKVSGLPQAGDMGDADVTASSWKNVEVGRVALFSAGPYAGRLAAIVQIIDHKRVRYIQPWSESMQQQTAK